MEFPPHSYDSICRVCGAAGRFVRQKRAIRETYGCSSCRATLRYRVQASAILALFPGIGARSLKELAAAPDFRQLTVFEPGIAGPFRAVFQRLPHYSKSFYWADLASGAERDGVVNQDLMALSLPDASVDLVITSDIFEHIRHPDRAFAEIARVLRPGGAHVFTIPMTVPHPPRSVQRVDVSGPADRHLLPEVYHGDGVGGRSLVYNDFGLDLIDQLEQLGTPTQIHAYEVIERPVNAAVAFVSVRKPL